MRLRGLLFVVVMVAFTANEAGSAVHPATTSLAVTSSVRTEPSVAIASSLASAVPDREWPLARSGQSSIYDPVAKQLVLFGGAAGGVPSGGVWRLSLASPSTWTLLSPSGPDRSQRFDHSAIYDAAHQRMIVFGGAANGNTFFNDVWALSLTEPSPDRALSAGNTAECPNGPRRRLRQCTRPHARLRRLGWVKPTQRRLGSSLGGTPSCTSS